MRGKGAGGGPCADVSMWHVLMSAWAWGLLAVHDGARFSGAAFPCHFSLSIYRWPARLSLLGSFSGDGPLAGFTCSCSWAVTGAAESSVRHVQLGFSWNLVCTSTVCLVLTTFVQFWLCVQVAVLCGAFVVHGRMIPCWQGAVRVVVLLCCGFCCLIALSFLLRVLVLVFYKWTEPAVFTASVCSA